MNNQKKKFILIDANALIHRSFHALPSLTTKTGQQVGAVYGFTSTLLKAINDLKPDYLAACYDFPAPTFRHEEYAEYKAKRVKAPDVLYEQIPLTKKVLEALNIPIFEEKGYEADDIIATLDDQANSMKGKLEVIIVTGDLDTLQLVDENTKVYTMKRGVSEAILYDEKAVRERFGVPPEAIVDYKGLRGDPSDNIPGVPGIGEKTASQLLKKYGNLENIYENIWELDLKLASKLRRFKEQAFFSRQLATLKKDAPIVLNLEKCLAHDYDKNKAIKLFEELEFKSLIPRLP
jgi:DNA polymerase-1